MQGRPVDELLGVAVERPALDQLEVEVCRTLEDRVEPGDDIDGVALTRVASGQLSGSRARSRLERPALRGGERRFASPTRRGLPRAA